MRASLASTAASALGRTHSVAAVATVTPEGPATASIGAADDADFEIGSVSTALTEPLEQTRGIAVGPTRAVYSNLGFQLLGHAVASASGVRDVELPQSGFGDAFDAPATVGELRRRALVSASKRGLARAPRVGEGIAPAAGSSRSPGTTAARAGSAAGSASTARPGSGRWCSRRATPRSTGPGSG